MYESFDKYCEVEELQGDNKYRTESHGLQDAIKGLKFESLPPVLQLHLRRFDYDYQRDTMLKVYIGGGGEGGGGGSLGGGVGAREGLAILEGNRQGPRGSTGLCCLCILVMLLAVVPAPCLGPVCPACRAGVPDLSPLDIASKCPSLALVMLKPHLPPSRPPLCPPALCHQLNDRYEFPQELDLDREHYLSRNADRGVRNLYKLHSVLVHSGGVHGGWRCVREAGGRHCGMRA